MEKKTGGDGAGKGKARILGRSESDTNIDSLYKVNATSTYSLLPPPTSPHAATPGAGKGKEKRKKTGRFRTFLGKMKAMRRKKAKGEDEGMTNTEMTEGGGEDADDEGAYDWLPTRVQNAPYFHGMIHKDELTCLLKDPGDCLLRIGRSDANARCVILSIFWNGAPRHFRINRDATGGSVWIDEGETYTDEVDLVESCKRKGTRLGANNIPVKNPVARATWELDKADIDLRKEIGKGAYGRVHHGYLRLKTPGTQIVEKIEVAIKTCDLAKESLEAQNVFMKEAEIGRRYPHRHVIKVYGIQCREPPLMIVMEYAPDGCLRDFLRANSSTLGEATLVRFARDACSALEFLAKVKILHRDIAARNFLLAVGRCVKVSDFGLAKANCLNLRSGSAKLKLAIKWLAPEVLTLGEFSLASEVWMFGVTLWEIMTRGKEPFPELSKEEVKVRMRTNPFHLEPEPSWPAPVREALAAAFIIDPARRATIGDLARLLDQALGLPPATSTTKTSPPSRLVSVAQRTIHQPPKATQPTPNQPTTASTDPKS